jgi:hypothetical protein
MVVSSRPVGLTVVGQRRVQPAAIAALMCGIVITGMVVSTVIASRLQFSAELGPPIIWHVYDPFAWLRWLGMAYGPKCYNYIAHTGCYAPPVYAALSDWLRLFAYGVGASVVVYAVVSKRLAPKSEKVTTLVDEAHFADASSCLIRRCIRRPIPGRHSSVGCILTVTSRT